MLRKKKKKEKDKAYEAFLAKRTRSGSKKALKMPTLYFTEERFLNNAKLDPSLVPKFTSWRMKERMKTVSVALVLCLNIGVDPPDVVKPSPCARLECWIDPFSAPPQRALHSIGVSLQMQYERWHHKARYKQCLDPTGEEVKKLCQSMRRNAKDERILFHYNGHGVPRPTTNGEIWVFNKNFTQYIPLSIYELQTWMCSPSIYVFDCSAAGTIINWFQTFAQQREREYERLVNTNSPNANGVVLMKDCILLAACGANEILPMNPELPADVFTSCLTTPIKMALRWFCSHSLLKGITTDMIDKIPGRLADRRTPLGELNWIFTAVTDTIAWNVLPVELFQKLFRQDLLVASLFRNFLLAERIMRSVNCTPISCPKLPSTYQHPMWQAWDLAAELCLSQLPELLENPNSESFKHSTFFTEQLTAFEIWLDFAHENKKPPEQLPIVLQVLLSQTHRLRALLLLGRFLDLGSWAVNQALSVGIFPYVLKLLQSPAPDLRQILVFIWAKILALDRSCQIDLVREHGHTYFISALAVDNVPVDQRTMSAFVLSAIMNNCRAGQSACLNANILPICLSLLSDKDAFLRRWVTFCLAKFWENFEEAKWCAIRESAHERLCSLLTDPVPEVRAAAIYALGTFIGGGEGSEQRTNIELNLGLTLPVALPDSSPMVRKELIIALSRLIASNESQFKEVAYEVIQEEASAAAMLELRKEEEKKLKASVKKEIKSGSSSTGYSAGSGTSLSPGNYSYSSSSSSSPSTSYQQLHSSSVSPPSSLSPPLSTTHSGSYISRQQSSVYGLLWKMVLSLTTDPAPELAMLATTIVQKITAQIINRAGMTTNDQRSNSSARFLGSLKRSSGNVKNTPNTPLIGLRSSSQSLNLAPKFADQGSQSSNNSTDGTGSGTTQTGDEGQEANGGISSTSPMLSSCLYDWSCGYFSRPINNKEDTDDTTPIYIERLWRKERNKIVYKEAVELSQPFVQKFDEQIGLMDNEAEMAGLLFHPYENMLVVPDDKDGLKIWNWEDSVLINSFKNTNVPGSRISAINLINETDIAMLLVGSDDGVVRIWRNFWKSDQLQLASAWRALSDLPQGRPIRGNGMVVDWQQQNGLLMTSGDVSFIRVWDVAREQAIQDIPTGSSGCVTSLTNDKQGGRTLVAGCGDGSVRIYDCRTPSRYNLCTTFLEHNSWLVKVEVPKSEFKIISGASSGDIKFWDPRGVTSLNTIPGTSGMTAFAVHDFAPILASGSQTQKIKIHNFSGEEVSMIRYHDGFLGQRIGPVSSLCFHPYKMVLAAGATDSIISLYESTSKRTSNSTSPPVELP